MTAFVLHLYQPVTQEKEIFNNIYNSCYLPLLKLIKNKKEFNLTINAPLSLLKQMDQYGHQDWIEMLKELIASEKVELTGSAAYHPLLTRLPRKFIEEEIVLNEYALGYYLGRRTGFEGEPSIMIKNINGFFPPELAINSELIKIVDELGYRWMLADECALKREGDRSGIYSFKDYDIKLVLRSRELSNVIAFKRSSDIDDITHLLHTDRIVVLDGETFGHHNKEGMLLLENVVDYIQEKGGQLATMFGFVNNHQVTDTFDSPDVIQECTWGASDEDIIANNVYPMWNIKDNSVHKKLWEIQDELVHIYEDFMFTDAVEDSETAPIWKSFPTEEIRQQIMFHESLNSDKFWWISGKKMPGGEVLHHPGMVIKSVEMWKKLNIAGPLMPKIDGVLQELRNL